ncbi:MAG: hypothetical protein EOP53_01610 [Sphingobacteriales bacterium]|nr:MAG: hypothetical protein EOP53_01610 [Sphingobacteriales bacterium]
MLIEKVRLATADNHKKLEEQLFPYINAIQLKEQYAKLLNAFYGYIFPVQEKIIQFINKDIVPDIMERRNASFIANDLAALNFPLNNNTAVALPDIKDHASAMGALYVLEGSTLGGKIISKTIADKLQSTEALSFFKGYGPETGPMWKKFTQYLEHPYNLEHAETVAGTATQTFLLFGTWFEKSLPVTNKA